MSSELWTYKPLQIDLFERANAGVETELAFHGELTGFVPVAGRSVNGKAKRAWLSNFEQLLDAQQLQD